MMIATSETTAPPGRMLSSLHGAPPHLTPLLGRESELAAIRRAILDDGIRLLTLAGPPGIGKTRLAIEAAEAVAPAFADGAWFVDLANISDAAAVPRAMVADLRARAEGVLPLISHLHQRLHYQELLIVLDNFEHVLSAADVVDELLTSHSNLSVLITSRQPLRLKWEHTMAISPLAVPLDEEQRAVEALMAFPSVQLFLQRARATRLDFAVTPENARVIANICEQLEGVPLAIELAAGWVHLLPPSAILEHLKAHLSFLHSRTRDVPARQRSLEAALDWSYNLLNGPEQTLLRRLSVCVDGFSLDAAVAIAGDVGQDVLESLTGLVDKSLLQSEIFTADEPRFRLLDTIHTYGLERLRAQGEAEETHRRHAEYYLALAEHA